MGFETGVILQIEELPDYPALQQLARALWREGTARGAAVLVGSGFSKFADITAPDTPIPPIWSEFARDMGRELYPGDPEGARIDPLRLAEEYRTYFGQAALDEFIHIRIRDAAWQPGLLHRMLLGLDWSDVMTTNWDTLLERAAESINVPRYEIVRCEADLGRAHLPGTPRNPRIVKLHGSIGTTEHFVVAEEDYRRYPQRFAAFVNLARQIFIENELCLLGFSGDDPNFLQWSGWVRDNLGENARRIYLVGALDLHHAKRKLLESRNIAPIDLSPLIQSNSDQDRHRLVIHRLLEHLQARKPKPATAWMPTPPHGYSFRPKTQEEHEKIRRDRDYAASILRQCCEVWKKDREGYPGWLICPYNARRDIQTTMGIGRITQEVVDTLSPEQRDEVAFELGWRLRVGEVAALSSELVSLLSSAANAPATSSMGKLQRLETAAVLLRAARRTDDEQTFLQWVSVIERGTEPLTDLRAEVAHQKALLARDRLDHDTVRLEASHISGPDPVWRLRRAALLAEIGDLDEARALVGEVLADLERRQRSAPGSVWVLSRRAWAEWVARGMQLARHQMIDEPSWSHEFKSARCDPEDEIDHLRDKIVETSRQQQEDAVGVQPLFEAGTYTDGSSTIRFVGGRSLDLSDALDVLTEAAGIPLRIPGIDFVAHLYREICSISYEASARWHIRLVQSLGDPSHRQFERYFGRVPVAKLPPDVASTLWDAAWRAVSYWRGKVEGVEIPQVRMFATGRVRIWVEVLARLTIRQNDIAKLREGLAVAADIMKEGPKVHWWLYDPVSHLVDYSIEALPPEDRSSVVLAMLEFPLPGTDPGPPYQWPETTHKLFSTRPSRSDQGPHWRQAVANLIEAAGSGGSRRIAAVRRLAYLAHAQALTADEGELFGEELWAQRDTVTGLPANTGLLESSYASLPAPSRFDREGLLRACLYECDVAQLLKSPEHFSSFDIAARRNRLCAMSVATPVKPTRGQSVRVFDQVVHLRPLQANSADPFCEQFVRSVYGAADRYLGEMVWGVLVPAMLPEDLTCERVDAIIALVDSGFAGIAAGALPFFLANQRVAEDSVVRGVHEALSGRTEYEVYGGVLAIQTWIDLAATVNRPVPRELLERILSSVEARRETAITAMLRCLRKAVSSGLYSEADIFRIGNVLHAFVQEWDYASLSFDSPRVIVASLLRAECVRLAHTLERPGVTGAGVARWLEIEQTDPLPEVRFAMRTEDSPTSIG